MCGACVPHAALRHVMVVGWVDLVTPDSPAASLALAPLVCFGLVRLGSTERGWAT